MIVNPVFPSGQVPGGGVTAKPSPGPNVNLYPFNVTTPVQLMGRLSLAPQREVPQCYPSIAQRN